MTAKHLKGEYNLNPTSQVMKQGSKQERFELSKGTGGRVGQRGLHPNDERADYAMEGGVEEQVHDQAHPAMQTRHSHPKNARHTDGRKHEEDHHAVRQLKGMK